VNSKAIAGLVAGALVIGLFVGLALGSEDGSPEKAAGPGPTKVVGGVPVGYERSRAGAVQAALNYSEALAKSVELSTDERRGVVRAIARRDRADEIFGELRAAYRLLDETFAFGSGTTDAIASYGVLGYEVKAFDSTTAEIALWEVSVFGLGKASKAEAGWSTTTVKLRWIDADWKLDELPLGEDGPTPALRGAPSDPAELVASVGKFSGVRHEAD
jgi:hypothetical protein